MGRHFIAVFANIALVDFIRGKVSPTMGINI